jgi:hypothetical protein
MHSDAHTVIRPLVIWHSGHRLDGSGEWNRVSQAKSDERPGTLVGKHCYDYLRSIFVHAEWQALQRVGDKPSRWTAGCSKLR